MLSGCGRIDFNRSDAGDGASGDGTIDGPPPIAANLMFVTSVPQVIPTTGLAGLDAVCATAATAATLPGKYIAYASTSTVDAVDRIRVARGWNRVDGAPFADTADQVAAGALFTPPRIDEYGQRVPNFTATMTGTTDGRFDRSCSDYTSISSAVDGTTGDAWMTFHFSSMTPNNCSATYSVFCFGIDRVAQVRPMPGPVRHAFVSSQWTPGSGLAGADAHCQTDAASVALPGNYRALLATSTATAASRFDLTGVPWARVDDSLIAATPDALMQLQLETQFDRDVTGAHVGVFFSGSNWTGANTPTQFATLNESCNNWMDSTISFFGVTGATAWLDGGFFSANASSCNSLQTLYCLEQ